MFIKHTNIKAFTLIELMVVITIMSILATAAIPSYISYLQRAAVTETVTVLADYKIALSVFWSVNSRLPTTGDTISGPPADLPFNTQVTTNLPDSIQSLQLTTSGNGILITAVVQANLFSTYVVNNRTVVLGGLPVGNQLQYECGNFTTNATAITDIGFTDQTILPSGCNYNGVGTWLTTGTTTTTTTTSQ